MISNEIQEICRHIGQFYLAKNDHDYRATQNEIEHLQITKIEIDTDKKLTIESNRPGILIGVRGKNIEELNTYLQTNAGISHLLIREAPDCLLNYLIPAQY